MNNINFTFSDTIAGYVSTYNSNDDFVVLTTADNREFEVYLTDTTYAEVIRNLGHEYRDVTADMREMAIPGNYLFAYGVYYPMNNGMRFKAKHIVFTAKEPKKYCFEKQDWWINQVKQLGEFYLKSEFPDGNVDYNKYRTNIRLSGKKNISNRQETDTISRLVYGFSSAYLLTGEDRFLEAAEKGTEYLRSHMRSKDEEKGTCFWYHAVDKLADGKENKIYASEFGDDYDAIPCYEQIYALAGPVQTYRVTGDPRILRDAESTIRLFDNYFKDKTEAKGFFSHLDPITLDPTSDSLGHNKARKNWNSVGDHAPAYLINLWLATGKPEYKDFLEQTFDLITLHFPDYENSPFVNERFFQNWEKDQKWGWQQNRAVVGHNMKIAWNLTRMYNLQAKDEYRNLAQTIAEVLPKAGMDNQRGGWYDVMERELLPDEAYHGFVWHDRKAWWQQEQGILAYLIMHGVYGGENYLKLAQQSAAFYNAWFLDTQDGGVYFNVLANGLPYLLGTERSKGSHSMAGYHSFELSYLAAVYNNLLAKKLPLDLYFKPRPGGFEDNILRVQPDILPENSVKIDHVWINGESYDNYDAKNMFVTLPDEHGEIQVRVCLVPSDLEFHVDIMDKLEDGSARVSLNGSLSKEFIPALEECLDTVLEQGNSKVDLYLNDLEYISPEVLRFIIYKKQKLKEDLKICLSGASGQVKQLLHDSDIKSSITIND